MGAYLLHPNGRHGAPRDPINSRSATLSSSRVPPWCRQPTTQLRWVEPDGRMMVRLEGQPAGRAEGGGMRAAVAKAAGRLGKDGRWFQSLLELAAQR